MDGSSDGLPSIAQADAYAAQMARDATAAAEAIEALGCGADDDAEQKKLTAAILDMNNTIRVIYHLPPVTDLKSALETMQQDMAAWQKLWSKGIPSMPPPSSELNPVLPYYLATGNGAP